jgi:DUF1365 family protein
MADLDALQSFPEPHRLKQPEYGLMLNVDELRFLAQQLREASNYGMAVTIRVKVAPLLEMAERDAR